MVGVDGVGVVAVAEENWFKVGDCFVRMKACMQNM